MNLDQMKRLAEFCHQTPSIDHYGRESSQLAFIMHRLAVTHEYMEQAEQRDGTLTSSILDTLEEVTEALEALRLELCVRDNIE